MTRRRTQHGISFDLDQQARTDQGRRRRQRVGGPDMASSSRRARQAASTSAPGPARTWVRMMSETLSSNASMRESPDGRANDCRRTVGNHRSSWAPSGAVVRLIGAVAGRTAGRSGDILDDFCPDNLLRHHVDDDDCAFTSEMFAARPDLAVGRCPPQSDRRRSRADLPTWSSSRAGWAWSRRTATSRKRRLPGPGHRG